MTNGRDPTNDTWVENAIFPIRKLVITNLFMTLNCPASDAIMWGSLRDNSFSSKVTGERKRTGAKNFPSRLTHVWKKEKRLLTPYFQAEKRGERILSQRNFVDWFFWNSIGSHSSSISFLHCRFFITPGSKRHVFPNRNLHKVCFHGIYFRKAFWWLHMEAFIFIKHLYFQQPHGVVNICYQKLLTYQK